jgi:hypothetical protein
MQNAAFTSFHNNAYLDFDLLNVQGKGFKRQRIVFDNVNDEDVNVKAFGD